MLVVEIQPFRLEHLWELDIRPEWPYQPQDHLRTWKMASEHERLGPAFTMVAKGKVIACGGVAITPPGVGTAWVVASDEMRRFRKSFHRVIKQYLESIIHHFALRRVQAMVVGDKLEGFTTNIRWIESLGFRYESTMAKAGYGGEDQHIYVMFR